MATFKNATDHRIDVPAYDLRLAPGDTFEIPDSEAAPFEANPFFAVSKTQSPTVTVDAGAIAAATGTAPAVDATPAA